MTNRTVREMRDTRFVSVCGRDGVNTLASVTTLADKLTELDSIEKSRISKLENVCLKTKYASIFPRA